MFDALYLSIAVIYGVLITFVIRQRMTSSAHRFFLFFLISLLLWHLTLYLYLFIPLGDWLLLVGRFNYAMGPLFTFGLLGFFSSFPNKDYGIPKKTEWGLWLWTIFLALVSLATPLIDKQETYVEGIGPVVEFGEWYLLYMIHMFAMPALTLAFGFIKYLKLKGLSRTKFGLSFGVFVPTMFAFVVTNGILPLYEIYWQFTYSPVFLIPIALSSAYAMYRYRFFDLSYSALAIIRQVILVFVFLGMGIFTYYALEHFETSTIVRLISALLIACFTRQQLEKILPEFTSRSFRLFRHHLQMLQSQLYSIQSYDELLKTIETVFLLKLHLSKTEMFLVRNQKISLNIPIYKRNQLIESLEKDQQKILVREEVQLTNNEHLLKAFTNLGAELIFPLYLKKQVIGIVILGQKEDGTPFTQEEVNELLIARELLEISFINILLQSDLKEENDLMKQLIDDKTKKLRQQNSKIKKLLQQQSDFIAVTAHEFRTPLNIALLQLNDTLDSFDLSHQVLDDMKVLESSLDKLKQLTTDLFDVQQYDLKKASLHLIETDIGAFLEEICEQFQDIAKTKSITLSFDNTLKKITTREIDQPKIRQVIHNLLSNAQKFSPEGSHITVRLTRAGKSIQIEVIDQGKGIPDKDKKRVFQKFQTADQRQGVGIGMGLYLCQQIVELHKGEIVVKDTPGGGCTFQISLPQTR